MLKIKLLLATMSNEPLGDIDDEGEPPLSPSMTTTNRDKPYLPSDIDMTSSNDSTKELQTSDNVLSIPSVCPSTNSANTGKQKMKATGMRTRGRGTPVGQGAYITQQKLKIRGGSI